MTSRRSAITTGLGAALALLAGRTPSAAATAGEINAGANATLDRLYRQIPGTNALAARAAGVLGVPDRD
jgi:hypothetical protein